VKPEGNTRANPLRNWATHVVVFALAQGALAAAGYSWPVEALFGEPHDVGWYLNSSGHWLLNAGRIWTVVFMIDTVWSLGRFALRRRSETRY
jgi:DHA1 family multidrug resistance protein-like MFS transporter